MLRAEPTDKQSYQYASHIKRVGKFGLKLWTLSGCADPYIDVLERVGWDLSRIQAITVSDKTVYIKGDGWNRYSPIKRVGLLNHECAHVALFRRYGRYYTTWKYITDSAKRYRWERDARIRNLETMNMFGVKITDRYIANCAKGLRTAYLLPKKYADDMIIVLKIVRDRLEAGTHRSDSMRLWDQFLRSTNKRRAVIK